MLTINIYTIILMCISIMASVVMIFTLNGIYSIFLLVVNFIAVAIILLMLGLEFLPIIFLIVYIGAIAVLFLFVVMLLNLKVKELAENFKNKILFLISICLVILLLIYFIFSHVLANDITKIDYNLGMSLVNYFNRAVNLTEISNIAQILYETNSLVLILAAYILLVAMIGAILLTLNHNKFNITKVQNKQSLKQTCIQLYSNINTNKNLQVINYNKFYKKI